MLYTTHTHIHTTTISIAYISYPYKLAGFESDSTSERRKDSASFFTLHHHHITSNNPFNASSTLITYWDDENSLWNPNLITPDPSLMESPSTFSSPYLDDSSTTLDYEVKAHGSSSCGRSGKGVMDILPGSGLELNIANVEAAIQVDDDVFY